VQTRLIASLQHTTNNFATDGARSVSTPTHNSYRRDKSRLYTARIINDFSTTAAMRKLTPCRGG
ncbi:MAG: hypothetical protein II569_02110, partial [Paludibacteraceae bacterium]|nr:hypothetical protein [Paludibacteraceae bacterium]